MIRAATLTLLLLALAPLAEAQPFAERWRDKVRQYERENPTLGDDKDIVLFGSSTMAGWGHGGRVGRYLPTIGSRTVNRGISGDGIGTGSKTGLANRIDESVTQVQPKFVFIFNGRNSLGGHGATRVAEVYEQVVRKIQSDVPGVTVVVITVAPVRGRYVRLKGKIVAYNAKLKTVASNTGARLIDFHPYLVGSDGLMKREFTNDGLHFKSNGYAILGRLMESVVATVEREQAEAAAVQQFIADGEALLEKGTLDPTTAGALRREVASRRANPNRCFVHQTVEAYLASLKPAPEKAGGASGLRGLGGLGR